LLDDLTAINRLNVYSIDQHHVKSMM